MAFNGYVPLQPGVESLTQADDAPLTNRMTDELSKSLGDDWKRFARGTSYFTDAQVNNIDADEHNVYEKCYKMITQWQERSHCEVTVAMAKLNLISLGRNDLLHHVFRSSAVTHKTPSTTSTRGPTSLDGNLYSEATVSDLQFKHIQKLSNFLDTDQVVGIQNWKQLGSAVLHGDKDACDQLDTMHSSYSGSAKRFLKSLTMRYPTFTINQFKDIAIKHQRRDISVYIESLNCPPGKQFQDLSFSQQEKIARDMEKGIRGIADWRMFADSVGFTNDEIEAFKRALPEHSHNSPTKRLIDLLKQRYPLLNLTKIKIASSNIGRNDVAQYLGTVIEEIAMTKSYR